MGGLCFVSAQRTRLMKASSSCNPLTETYTLQQGKRPWRALCQLFHPLLTHHFCLYPTGRIGHRALTNHKEAEKYRLVYVQKGKKKCWLRLVMPDLQRNYLCNSFSDISTILYPVCSFLLYPLSFLQAYHTNLFAPLIWDYMQFPKYA